MQLSVRQASLRDIDPIRFLFRDTVTYINSADYTPEQIKLWSGSYLNENNWTKRVLNQYFLVVTAGEQILGFSCMEDHGYLDLLYIHKDHQRQGIAQRLLTEMETRAAALSLKRIYSHVSKTAQGLFEKNGYLKTGTKIDRIGKVEFVSAIMTKVF